MTFLSTGLGYKTLEWKVLALGTQLGMEGQGFYRGDSRNCLCWGENPDCYESFLSLLLIPNNCHFLLSLSVGSELQLRAKRTLLGRQSGFSECGQEYPFVGLWVKQIRILFYQRVKFSLETRGILEVFDLDKHSFCLSAIFIL